METFYEIMKYTLPALVVLGATYLVLWRTLKSEEDRKKVEIVLNNQKVITPVRLQAYERMILLLERISPQSMVMRTQQPEMLSRELQSRLLKNIRHEFEHNVAQQIYVSDKAWELVKNAKEDLVKTINQISIGVKPEAPAIHLSKRLLEHYMNKQKDPLNKALEYLRNEVRTLF